MQAEYTLAAVQERSDFRPPEEWMPETNPTLACQLMCPLLSSLGQLASSILLESNSQSYLAEVGTCCSRLAKSLPWQRQLWAPWQCA